MKKTVSIGNILSWGQAWLELKHTLSNSCSGLLNIHYLARTLDNYNEIWRYNKFITVTSVFLWAFSLTWQKSKQNNKNLKEVIQDSASPCVLSVRFYIMSDLASNRMGHLAHTEVILKEISPECSLEGMMLKLKLQYFGHLMRRADSLEKTLMLGGIGERRRRGRDGWMASLTRWMWVWVNSGSWWWTGRPGVLRFMGLQRVGHDWVTELNWTELNWTELKLFGGINKWWKWKNLKEVCLLSYAHA